MNAGTATWTMPNAMPNVRSTPHTVRMPGAASGPSQPASWGIPRQRRDAGVNENATAALAPSVAAIRTAAVGDARATISATIAGAVTTATSNAIATIAYAVSRCSSLSASMLQSDRIGAGNWGIVEPPNTAMTASSQPAACS